MAAFHFEDLQASSLESNGSNSFEASTARRVPERSMPPRRFASQQVHKQNGYFNNATPGIEDPETINNLEQSSANGQQRRFNHSNQAQQLDSISCSTLSKNRARSDTFPIISEMVTLARGSPFWPYHHCPSTSNISFGYTDSSSSSSSSSFSSYKPLHYGPHVTVSSGDGTEFWNVDPESSNFRNAAAQCLYRSLQQRSVVYNGQILDGHMEMIFGAVEEDVNVLDVGAWREVVSVNKDEDWRSVVGMVEMEKRGGKELRLRIMEWFKRRCGMGKMGRI
jgi:hypothetical protein